MKENTHWEKHVCHVLFDGLVINHDIHRFVNASALSSQDGLINAETTRWNREQSTVRRDFVTDRDRDDVSRHEIGRMYTCNFARPENLCFVWRIFFQRLHNAGSVMLFRDVKISRTSIAFSALDSWITPTAAFATKIRRMTRGSTNAPRKAESEESSKRANMNETTAEASKIRTSWSLNCSKINSQRGVAGSSGSSVKDHEQGVADNIEQGTFCTIFPVFLSVFRCLGCWETLLRVYLVMSENIPRQNRPWKLHQGIER